MADVRQFVNDIASEIQSEGSNLVSASIDGKGFVIDLVRDGQLTEDVEFYYVTN